MALSLLCKAGKTHVYYMSTVLQETVSPDQNGLFTWSPSSNVELLVRKFVIKPNGQGGSKLWDVSIDGCIKPGEKHTMAMKCIDKDLVFVATSCTSWHVLHIHLT